MTHQYELMVILDPEIDERTVAPSLDKFLNVIRNDGGTIENVDIWGRRRLAYEIKKKAEGIYAVVNFTAKSETSVELDRQLKLSEAVLRTKVLRSEEAAARVVAHTAEEEAKADRKAKAIAKAPAKPAAKADVAPKAEAAPEPAAVADATDEPKPVADATDEPAAVADATDEPKPVADATDEPKPVADATDEASE